jgi:predicted O-methyltransferase YrrM
MNPTMKWEKVDQYLTEKLIPHDPLLEQVLHANKLNELPTYDVSPVQGKLLNLLVQIQGATRILEIGTLGGYSTIWMGRALPQSGKIVTLEIDPLHAKVAQANIDLANLPCSVEIRVGNALDQLAQMKQKNVESFDFIFIDADKPNNPHYLKWALEFSHPGTLIIGDNVIRHGEVINSESEDPRVQGVRQFYDLLAEEKRITATAIQTVGQKGYDGFVMGVVTH